MLTWEMRICGNSSFTSHAYVLLSEADLRIKWKPCLSRQRAWRWQGASHTQGTSQLLYTLWGSFMNESPRVLKKVYAGLTVNFTATACSQSYQVRRTRLAYLLSLVSSNRWNVGTTGMWLAGIFSCFAAADKHYSHPTRGLASISLPWVGLAVMQCSNNGRSGAGECFGGAWEALMSPSCTFCIWREWWTNGSRRVMWNCSGKTTK